MVSRLLSEQVILECCKDSIETAALYAGYSPEHLDYLVDHTDFCLTANHSMESSLFYFGKTMLPSESDYSDGKPYQYEIIVYNPLSAHSFFTRFGLLAIQSLIDHELIGHAYAHVLGSDGCDESLATAHQILLAVNRAKNKFCKEKSRWQVIGEMIPRVMCEQYRFSMDDLFAAQLMAKNNK